MKLYFCGTDVLLLNTFPKQLPRRKIFYVLLYRLFIRLSKFCTEEYWVVHSHLLPELRRFGIRAKVVIHPFNKKVYPKKEHRGFNILYYCPRQKEKELNEWIYGYDIYVRIKQYYKDDIRVCFLEVDGFCDLALFWPVTDFYLRCNRHDGGGRMVDEARINSIPYYWSTEKPDFNEIIRLIEIARAK